MESFKYSKNLLICMADYPIETSLESRFERELYALDGKLGPRRMWEDAVRETVSDDILKESIPRKAFPDDPKLGNSHAAKALEKSRLFQELYTRMERSQEYDRVKEGITFLYNRKGLAGRFLMGYEVSAGKDLDMAGRIDEVVQRGDYTQEVGVALNTNNCGLRDLDSPFSPAELGILLFHLSIDKDGRITYSLREYELEPEIQPFTSRVLELKLAMDKRILTPDEISSRVLDFFAKNRFLG